jgi:site-specific recombinase XerD
MLCVFPAVNQDIEGKENEVCIDTRILQRIEAHLAGLIKGDHLAINGNTEWKAGLRRRELADLEFTHLQQREEHWAIVDLVGKGGHIRTIPMPEWVKATIDVWVTSAGISEGRLFRCVCRAGKCWGKGVTERVVWQVVKQYAKEFGITQLAPHDIRRSCAKLCHATGGELEQIQFLLGHVSVQTTERYLGCKQRIRGAVNDCIGIEPSP